MTTGYYAAVRRTLTAVGIAAALPLSAQAASFAWEVTDTLFGAAGEAKSYLIRNDGAPTSFLPAGPYAGGLFDVGTAPFRALDSITMAIFRTGQPGTPVLVQEGTGTFTFSVTIPDSYTAIVVGKPVAGGGFPVSVFSANVSLVPEPETWAMMIVGVGLVGWQLRRKIRSSQATRLV